MPRGGGRIFCGTIGRSGGVIGREGEGFMLR
jgi:hypothetical protein